MQNNLKLKRTINQSIDKEKKKKAKVSFHTSQCKAR